MRSDRSATLVAAGPIPAMGRGHGGHGCCLGCRFDNASAVTWVAEALATLRGSPHSGTEFTHMVLRAEAVYEPGLRVSGLQLGCQRCKLTLLTYAAGIPQSWRIPPVTRPGFRKKSIMRAKHLTAAVAIAFGIGLTGLESASARRSPTLGITRRRAEEPVKAAHSTRAVTVDTADRVLRRPTV